jgi:hypothetical protein
MSANIALYWLVPSMHARIHPPIHPSIHVQRYNPFWASKDISFLPYSQFIYFSLIPTTCIASPWTTASHLVLGFPSNPVFWIFPLRIFFWGFFYLAFLWCDPPIPVF